MSEQTRILDGAQLLRAHLVAPDERTAAGLVAVLARAGVPVVPLDGAPEAPVVAAGRTVEEAVQACPEPVREGKYGLLVVADTVAPAAVRRAVRAGIRTMLPRAGVTPARLATALQSALYGDGWMPYSVLVRLLGTAPPDGGGQPPIGGLTARQSLVLRMIADGHGNAAIARDLSCSEHTVKNVIYDLMARLQVNNRAHAVAQGIRTGLI